jgi:peptidoglycan-N-acetylglucosamine deacetylase
VPQSSNRSPALRGEFTPNPQRLLGSKNSSLVATNGPAAGAAASAKARLLQPTDAGVSKRIFRALRFMFRFLTVISLLVATRLLAQQVAPSATPTNTPRAAPEAKMTISSVHVDGPYIALTFDDGPDKKLTPRLLDLLAQHHIHATFFVVGENAAAHPEILQRALREGHEIGNHSWSHPNFAKMSEEAVRSQVRRTEEAITNATGLRPTLLRPPYGSVTARQKRWLHDELGYEIILWDVDPLDWKNPGPSVVTNRIVKETRAGSIVLSHDIHAQTIEAMPQTLRELEEKGFQFVTVSQLLKMATTPTPTPKPVSASAAAPSPAISPGS